MRGVTEPDTLAYSHGSNLNKGWVALHLLGWKKKKTNRKTFLQLTKTHSSSCLKTNLSGNHVGSGLSHKASCFALPTGHCPHSLEYDYQYIFIDIFVVQSIELCNDIFVYHVLWPIFTSSFLPIPLWLIPSIPLVQGYLWGAENWASNGTNMSCWHGEYYS